MSVGFIKEAGARQLDGWQTGLQCSDRLTAPWAQHLLLS